MNNELVAVLDYLERDRGLDRNVLVQVIEESLVQAARKAIGPANELSVKLDPKSGDITATAKLTVVANVEHPDSEIAYDKAHSRMPDVSVGDEIEWEVTPRNFGRIAAQTAKQSIMQRLRQAERSRVQDDFSERIGEVLYGVITRFEKGDVIIDFTEAEGALIRKQRVHSEDYQPGDHICCVLVDLNVNGPGPILHVSRSHPDLVRRLFEREVTEIAEGIVTIEAVAREAGFRSKIAVNSKDSKVDPVGACVGIRGSRVKTIVRELSGEKVDIIRWDENMETFIASALQPAKLKKITLDAETNTANILVEPDQLSLAIGRRGQNARLASKLTGWKIDIDKFEEKPELTIEERMTQAADALATLPGISRDIAEKLVQHGFLTADGIREADDDDLNDIEGLDATVIAEIKKAVSE